jgi:hypothetical protein
MTRPLPNSHVTSEPWFRHLLKLATPPGAPMRGLEPPREFGQACVEVAEARADWHNRALRHSV